MNRIKFAKMTGAGNDFIIVDNRSGKIEDRRAFGIETCNRKMSVGADGVAFIEKPINKGSAFLMRLINADGSEADMCGNAVRCIAYLALKMGIAGRRLSVDTPSGIKHINIAGPDNVTVNMGLPSDLRLNIALKTKDKKYNACHVNTGVPHAIVFDGSPDVNNTGREIRFHKSFGKKGANANFVKVLGKKRLQVRTYERGVEAETLACGTGATAAALISNMLGKTEFPTTVVTSGGELLRIDMNKDGQLFMSGGVKLICEGMLFY